MTANDMTPIDRYRANAEACAEFVDYCSNLPDQPTRRWAYEIEAHNLGRVSNLLHDLGLDTTADGSVDSECECDCSDCQHSCDCDHCSIDSWDLDHSCGCADSECFPKNERPVMTTHDRGRLAEACSLLDNNAYLTDECGGHIHVDASGVTPVQVASIMTAWRKVAELLPELIGRDYTNYAKEIEAHEIEQFRKCAGADGDGYHQPDRYIAVNVQNYLSHRARGRGKNTIEFRQFGPTLDPAVIVARGFLARGLVAYFLNGGALYWLLRADSARSLLATLGHRF